MLSIDEFKNKSGSKVSIYKDIRLKAESELTTKTFVIIPDMHLLEGGADDDFVDSARAMKTLSNPNGFETRFVDFLNFLLKIRKDLKDNLEIVQVGDMYDLWQARGNTNMIETRYENVLGKINELKIIYAIGNHDIDLWNLYKDNKDFNIKWRHFSSTNVGEATIMFEHGFQADFCNNQDKWSGVIGRRVTEIVAMMEYIDPDIDLQLGSIWDSISNSFSIYNSGLTPVKNPEGFNTHEYLNYYIDRINKYRKGETDDHKQASKLVCAVIGHTHKARLVTRPNDGTTFYLMDCGSWVNGGHEFGIITGNELAVCQWG